MSRDATCGPGEVTKKKGQKLSCVKLAICPDHPRRHRPLKFCVRGRVREVVIYFKFHENQSRGLGAVRGRKSPSPIDKAHGLYSSLYYRTSRDTIFMAPFVERERYHSGPCFRIKLFFGTRNVFKCGQSVSEMCELSSKHW